MKKKIREFLAKKKAAAGCILAAAIIAAGGLGTAWYSSNNLEMPSYTDPVTEATIVEDDTPLASSPKVTTKTTQNTKTSTKKTKMKSASKKTYTKKIPTTKKTTKKTQKKNSTTTVTTQTTVQTDATEKYTKKSCYKITTTKVKTIVKTTTSVATATATKTSTSASTKTTSNSKYTVSNLASVAPKMDSRVINAFNKMGFKVVVDPSSAYAGYFSAKTRTITLQEMDDTIYHELGHFLSFIAGNVDVSSSFKSIYASEKSQYTLYNKAYVTKDSSEYFAESVKNYMLTNSTLKKERPQTYNAIKAALDKVTTSRINSMISLYSVIWK